VLRLEAREASGAIGVTLTHRPTEATLILIDDTDLLGQLGAAIPVLDARLTEGRKVRNTDKGHIGASQANLLAAPVGGTFATGIRAHLVPEMGDTETTQAIIGRLARLAETTFTGLAGRDVAGLVRGL
jgi:hypothetical protein